MTNPVQNIETSTAEVKAKAQAKQPKHQKLKLDADSFLLGSSAASMTESRWFSITLPSDHTLGTDNEATEVRNLAIQISKIKDAGVVVKVGIRSGLWEIVIALPTPQSGDIALLEKVSRALKPVTDAAPILKTGFSAIKLPRWAFLIGNFVSADGLFL